MCNRLPDLLGIIFSIHLQLWSESLWELKVKQFKFRLEDAAAFLCDLWNRHSEVTPATPTHALELARPGGNRGRDKPALSCYGQAEANLLCCCSLWSTAVPIWTFSNTQFKTALCLSVWVTATWWLYCFCLHLMQMMFFQFLRWRSQCANKCGLDMRSMQETDVSWQKSTAVMLLKVLILFLFLVIFTWQLWSQFSAIYLGIQKKATSLFSELLCGKSTVPHSFLFPYKHLPWARLNAIQVGCARHPEPGQSSGSDQQQSITQILLLVLKYRVIGLSWWMFQLITFLS